MHDPWLVLDNFSFPLISLWDHNDSFLHLRPFENSLLLDLSLILLCCFAFSEEEFLS